MLLPLHVQRRDYIHIDPPARDYGRLPRVGKHARGKAPRVLDGQVEARPPSTRPGVHLSAAGRKQSTARSVHEGTSIAAQKAQDRDVAKFVNGLTGKDRAFAIQCGLLKKGRHGLAEIADTPPSGPDRSSDEHLETDEPAIGLANGGTYNGRPMHHGENMVLDEIEPEKSAPLRQDHLTDMEIARAHDDFTRVIAWVHVGKKLIKKAHRLAALIAWCRPDLAASLPQCSNLELELEQLDICRVHLAVVFGRVFVWAREAPLLSALGIRANVIAYVVRPSLLDQATNKQIGAPLNNTRAAINKLVQEFREAFAGIRASSMRDESTRHACRRAQFV